MDNKLTGIITELVCRDFDIEAEGVLQEVLATRIADMMQDNPTLLKSIFYRIDLNESLLGMALVSMKGRELHLELARQVIERMQKKAETRLKWSQGN
jgi:hypothetical protein